MSIEIEATPLTVSGFIVGFITLWQLGILLMRKLSGWQRLSRFHVDKADFRNSMRANLGMSGSALGCASFPSRIKYDQESRSVFIKPVVLFGSFHKTLKIPSKCFTPLKDSLSNTQFSVSTDCRTRKVLFIFDERFSSHLMPDQRPTEVSGGQPATRTESK